MPLGAHSRKVVHAAILGLAQRDRFERRLPTQTIEGPFRRESLLRRIVNRIRRKP